jgi:hypothetical protein
MAAFTLKVHVHNRFSRRKPEPGHIIYTTPQRYRVRFSDHTHYVPKNGVGIIDRASTPRALDVGGATMGSTPADDAIGVPYGSDVISGETDEELVDGSREPSVASGTGSVPRSVHSGAVRNLGVAMATQVGVANQTPPHAGGEMGEMVVRMETLQSTISLLAGRVAIMEMAAQGHTDMAAAIDGWFDELCDLLRGFHKDQGGVVFGPPPVIPMVVPPLGPAVANPRQVPVLPYTYELRQGTGMAQGNQVSPGGHLNWPVG